MKQRLLKVADCQSTPWLTDRSCFAMQNMHFAGLDGTVLGAGTSVISEHLYCIQRRSIDTSHIRIVESLEFLLVSSLDMGVQV